MREPRRVIVVGTPDNAQPATVAAVINALTGALPPDSRIWVEDLRDPGVTEGEHVEVRVLRFAPDPRRGEYEVVSIRAGVPTMVHVIPPAGERHAFDRKDYPVGVEVCVSPTGRSIQIHVNGERVELEQLGDRPGHVRG